jgi:hypothetical protein
MWPNGSPKLITATGAVYPRDAWAWVNQFWRCAAERAVAIGGSSTDEKGVRVFPTHTKDYFHGVVVGASETTITDSGQTASPAHQWAHQWYGYTPPPGSPDADDFDVIIDTTDERKTVRAHITSAETGTVNGDSPYGTILNIANLRDFVTQGVITSVSQLIGRDYWIVRHGDTLTAPWWSERRPRTEDSILWEGATTASSVVAGKQVVTVEQTAYASYGYGGDSSAAAMTVNAFVGKQLMVRGDDGFIKRVTILSNTADTFTIAETTWTASGRVVVVNSGTRVLLDKYPQQCDSWYSGALTSYWSHEPIGGTLAAFNAVPDSGVVWSEGDGFTCDDISHDGLNSDLWSSEENLCSEAGKSYSPLFYKSLRGLQCWIEGACTSFVDPTRTWDGGTAKPRTMTLAEFFAVCSINSGTSTVGAEDGGHWYATMGTLEGVSLYWTILNADFSVRREGTGAVSGGKIDLGTGLSGDEGETVVYSAGWTRHVARRFHYAYDKTVFLPDDDGGLVTTPTTTDPGTWSTRTASTSYTEPDAYGFTRYTDTSDAFVAGELAMYGGDSFDDPTTTDAGTLDDITAFEDHFYTGKGFPLATRTALAAKLAGTATSGTTYSLTTTGKAFYSGALITQTGTATSGSATTIVFSVADTNGFYDASTGRYIGFILKMTGGANIGLKRPISGMSVGAPSGGFKTVTLTVSPAFPNAISSGHTFAIAEPGLNPASQRVLNQYKGRTLTITKADGTTVSTTITHNDDDTIWFTDVGFSTTGLAWRIVEKEIGKTYQWDGAAWQDPSGTDGRTGKVFSGNGYAIEPTYVRRYGKINKRDVDWIGIYNELYTAINNMVWTLKTLSWTSNDDVNENHPFIDSGFAAGISISNQTEADAAYADIKTYCDGQYASNAPGAENDGTPPYAGTAMMLESTGSQADLGRAYAYARATGIAATFAHATDFYVYPTIDAADNDPAAASMTSDPVYIFDDNGDDTGTFRTWHLWNTEGAGSRNTDLSGALGDTGLTEPAWGSEPYWALGPPEVTQTVYRGWYAFDRKAILRWDVGGGFTYVA